MKKYILSLFVIGLFFVGFDFAYCAYPPVTEGPLTATGTGTTVSISTSAWTKVPTTTSLTGRLAVQVCNPSTNTASMYAIVKSATPSEAITVKPREIGKGSTQVIPCPDGLYLYLFSGHTSAESAGVQELK